MKSICKYVHVDVGICIIRTSDLNTCRESWRECLRMSVCSIKLNVIALNSEIYYDFVSRENGSKPMAYFCKINE